MLISYLVTSLSPSLAKIRVNTPGSRGWSRLRDQTLAVKSRKSYFFRKKKKLPNFFLVMPKYWVNTPTTRGWSRLRDQTLAVAKNRAKMTLFSRGKKNYLKKIYFFCIYLPVRPNYWGKQSFARGSPKNGENTPGTAGGPGGRDRTLAVKSRKNVRKITFFS